jgi:hypothetical protein
MEARPTHDVEHAKLIASTRYTRHDLVVDGITALAVVVAVVAVLFPLGSI